MGSGLYGGFGNTKGLTKQFEGKANDSGRIRDVDPSSPNDNLDSLKEKYEYDEELGKFGEKGKNARIIKSDNPIEDSSNFFDTISKGGKISELKGNKGKRVDFPDGSTIVYRIITSTKNSPAVDINVVNRTRNGISKQKIHFIRRNKND